MGGFCREITRYGIRKWFKKMNKTSFQMATFIINITGAFLLVYIVGTGLDNSWQLLVWTCFMVAYTT
ncbi:fluoride efflux transporter CrcB, partial [Bacillus cereus]|uniref:CrcB family protein n=1 Tax=Bacillus cereus TaxID=1396 RepID=UPI0032428674|nr:fluoride efflux transporter CrcB [Bacillus cereus]